MTRLRPTGDDVAAWRCSLAAHDGEPAATRPAPQPVESQARSRIAVPLADRSGPDTSAAQIADATVATWQQIDLALTPIIGSKGVAALYERSLHLTAAEHPWLARTREAAQGAIDLAALKAVVAQQSSADAALGSNTLLQTFCQLLGGLIGPALTERLLGSAWADSSNGPPARCTSP